MPTKEQLSRMWETEFEFPFTRREDDPGYSTKVEAIKDMESKTNTFKAIFTTLPYSNSLPHIGHCFEFVMADIITRYWRRKSKEGYIFFNTGVDEHGIKIQQAAKSLKLSPKEFCDQKAKEWEEFCKLFQIDYDNFYRTSNKIHKKLAKDYFDFIKNDLELKQYSGLYCVGCESFKTEKEIKDNKCIIRQQELEFITEENYFLNLSKYAVQVKDILVDKTLSKELEEIKQTFKEISITRKNIDWSVKIDEENSLYVWAEALMNYYFSYFVKEGKDYELFYGCLYSESLWLDYWRNSVIICGKDNLKFQAFILQVLMKLKGIPQNKEILVHGTILDKDGVKMSKSLGNVIDPMEQAKKYGVSPLRYYLFFGLNTFSDSKYSEQDLINIWNSEVCNNFGNLISRTLHLIDIRDVKLDQTLIDEVVINTINAKIDEIDSYFENYQFQRARQVIQEILTSLNKLINDKKPWEESSTDYESILRDIYFYLKILKNYFSIIIPEYSEKLEKAFKERKKVVLFTPLVKSE